jgi:fructokinase
MIVVAGEALVDLVAGEGDELRAHPGGAAFNVARTIGRLEGPVAYLGRISTDRFGARLRAALETDGVRLDSAVSSEQSTTLAVAELGGDSSAEYRFYVADTTAAGLTLEEARGALPSRVDMLLTGGLGLVLEPVGTTLEAVVEQVSHETLVALDPNCRPAAITDQSAYRARLGRVLKRCDLLKASEEDLAWLRPDVRPVQAARAVLDGGPDVAIVTRGAEGATVVTSERELDVSARPAKVVDTIGAGDAFSGALLAWWHRAGLGRRELAEVNRLVEATEFACRVAARTCERAGASPPSRAELAG